MYYLPRVTRVIFMLYASQLNSEARNKEHANVYISMSWTKVEVIQMMTY